MSDEQYLTYSELSAIQSLIGTLDLFFNARTSKNTSISTDPIKLYDSNGEMVGAVEYDTTVGKYVFRYPAPEES